VGTLAVFAGATMEGDGLAAARTAWLGNDVMLAICGVGMRGARMIGVPAVIADGCNIGVCWSMVGTPTDWAAATTRGPSGTKHTDSSRHNC